MFKIIQKNTWQGQVEVVDRLGDPIDVSGAAVKFWLWRFGDDTAAVELTEADTQISPNSDGTIDINLTETDTELDLGEYQLEVKVNVTTTQPYARSLITRAQIVNSADYQGING